MNISPVVGIPPGSFEVSERTVTQRQPTSVTSAKSTSDQEAAETQQTKPDRADPQEPSNQEQQQIKELAARDREVKAHEMAHKAAGGGLTGPINLEFTTGPDGKRYAAGGEVSIDISEVPGDPQATILKANRIRSAALAPAQPSAQDRQVAAQAARMAAQARMEIAQQSRKDESEDNNTAVATQFNRQPLYDSSGSVSSGEISGNVLDEMV